MQQLTHIDLFSGIGGFSLASSWAGFNTIVFCEKDKFCHKILNKHWPDVPIIEDIHEFDGSQYSGETLLTGGVPCQPASTAGKRRGTEDDRWLWPETLRVIGEAKPKWIILENVRGLISLNGGVEFDNLLSELEAIGYETRQFVIPACSVNAPHKRERVWIVAHTSGIGRSGRSDEDDPRQNGTLQTEGSRPSLQQGVLADSESFRQCDGHDSTMFGQATREIYTSSGSSCDTRELETWGGLSLSNLGYVDDGLSSRLVGLEPNIPRVTSTKDRDRVNKLRALGNAIVPQVAYQIIEKIATIEIQHQLSSNI